MLLMLLVQGHQQALYLEQNQLLNLLMLALVLLLKLLLELVMLVLDLYKGLEKLVLIQLDLRPDKQLLEKQQNLKLDHEGMDLALAH